MQLTLTIFFSDKWVSFSVYSNLSDSFLSHHEVSLANEKSLASSCDTFWKGQPYKNIDFQEVRVCFVSHNCSFYPVQFDNAEIESLFSFEHGLDKTACIDLRIKSNPNIKVATILPKEGLDWVLKQFKTAEVFDSRELLLTQLNNQTNENALYIQVHEQCFELGIQQHGKLVFQNIFDFATAEDIVYYTTYTLEQLKLKREQIYCSMYGKIEDPSFDVDLIQRFLPFSADYFREQQEINKIVPQIPLLMLKCI